MINPYYENAYGKLYHGDCLEIMPTLEVKVDAVITDPPYGTTACKWDSIIPFEQMWYCLKSICKDNGAKVLFGSEPFSSFLRCSNIKQFKYDWVWIKNRPTNFANAKRMPLSNIELISVFNAKIYNPQGLIRIDKVERNRNRSGGGILSGDNAGNSKGSLRTPKKEYIQEYTNYPRRTLEFNKVESIECKHPTQKPVALLEYLIKTYTNANEIVLDFTAGSGTTGVAAINTGRRFILIEKEEKYCEIAAKRLEDTLSEINKWGDL